MNHKPHGYIYAAGAAVAALCMNAAAYAQSDTTSTIDRSVDVVNAYQPHLRKARKIYTDPVIDDTAKLSDNFNYQLLHRVAVVTTKPDSLTAAEMDFPAFSSPYRARVEGGVGSLPAFYGRVTYNMGSSKKHHMSIQAAHLSQLGQVKLDDGSKSDAHQHDSKFNFNYGHFGKNLRFGIDLGFANQAYSYYGLSTLVDTSVYVSDDGVELAGATLAGDSKQRNSAFDLDITFANSLVDPLRKFTFRAGAGFGVFGNKSGVRQTDIRFGGNLRFPFREMASVDADINVNIYKVGEGDKADQYRFVEYSGKDISFVPHFRLDNDYMSLRLGLRVISVIGDDNVDKDDFIVQPDLRGDFFIGDGSVGAYVGLTGDYAANSYRRLVQMNRFMSPDTRKYQRAAGSGKYLSRHDIRHSQAPVVFNLGIKASFSKKVQATVGMTYKSLGDEVFFVNRHFALAADTTQIAYSSQFAVVQDDGKLFRLHGEVSVSPTANGRILLEATYDKYSMNELDEAWNKPICAIALSGRCKPTERLLLRAKAEYEGRRKAFDPTSATAKSLDGFFDLNIGGSYYISNRWTAFIDFSNITAADQQRWFGYSSYRFNAMVGATYKF